MSDLMHRYNNELTQSLRDAVENALDVLRDDVAFNGVRLAGDDRAARAAEALAVYILESMEG